MKKYLPLLCALMFLLSACKQENLQIKEIKTEAHTLTKFCFVKNLYKKEKYFASVDFIDLVKKGELDQKIGGLQIIEMPDSSCYVNKEKKFEDCEISDSVKIIMQKFSYDADGNFNFGQSVKITDLIRELEKSRQARFLFSPYEIKILNNKIVSLKEIYIP